jgi:hypothetical protein
MKVNYFLFFIVTCMLAGGGIASGQCVPPPSGMVAWWPGDNSTTDIVNGNNGTLMSGATYAAGKVLQAFDFSNGSGYLNVPSNGTLNFGTGDFSFDAWVRLPSGLLTRTLVDKRVPTPTVGYNLYIYNGLPGVQIADGSATNYNANTADHASICDNTWHHVAVTVQRSDTNGIRFYVDGLQLATTRNPTAHQGSLTETAPLRLGLNVLGALPLSGRLDEVELFNRILTPAEVLSIFQADSLGKCKTSGTSGPNHYKTWRVAPLQFSARVEVQDQFMTDSLWLLGIEFLSNPVKKIHQTDTFNIVKPNDHLTWYRAEGNTAMKMVGYVNQFESTAVAIDSVKYLLVPAQKLPYAPSEGLDHYKAYRIVNPKPFNTLTTLDDQFDILYGQSELIDSLKPVYFITPALKNMPPPMFDSVTHYVAYEIFPKRFIQRLDTTLDQFGMHVLQTQNSEFLLVPTRKISVSPTTCCTDSFDSGWNLLSIPYYGYTFSGLFGPTLISVWDWSASGCNYTNLTPTTPINPLQGYWVKLLAPTTVTICDVPVTSWSQHVESICGWNLVGSVACACDVGVNLPENSIANIWDGVTQNCLPATSLTPPYGTWFFTLKPGTLTATCPGPAVFDPDLAHITSKPTFGGAQISDTIPSWFGMLNISDGNQQRVLRFSELSSATDGFDMGLDIPVPPPHPEYSPDSSFDAWFDIATPVSLHLTCAINHKADTVEFAVRLSGIHQQIIPHLESVPTQYSVKLICAQNITYDLRNVDKLDFYGSQLCTLRVYKFTTISSVASGWNMISVPQIVEDYSKNSLFPTAISDAFGYHHSSYQWSDTLLPNKGSYWLKFASDQSIRISGRELDTATAPVEAGWNMIGSLSVPIPISNITSDPPGMITSNIYGYNGTYTWSDTVLPGKGYWVKVNTPGVLTLSATPLPGALPKTTIKIVSTNEMPPPPPDGSAAVERTIPKEYGLEQAYPNPFNPATTIKYELPTDSKVSLKVYNLLGQVVAVLTDAFQLAGYKSVEWNAGATSSSVYFYKLEATSIGDPGKSFVQVKKMLLLK